MHKHAQREFASFYEDTASRVYRICLAFSGDRQLAQDACQEAFTRAFARWSKLEKEAWVDGWVITTALNICRKSARQHPSGLVTRSKDIVSTDPDLNLDLLRSLRMLPPRMRQVALLFFVADLPLLVISVQLGMAEGTVKHHVFEARKSLQRSMTTEGGK